MTRSWMMVGLLALMAALVACDDDNATGSAQQEADAGQPDAGDDAPDADDTPDAEPDADGTPDADEPAEGNCRAFDPGLGGPVEWACEDGQYCLMLEQGEGVASELTCGEAGACADDISCGCLSDADLLPCDLETERCFGTGDNISCKPR